MFFYMKVCFHQNNTVSEPGKVESFKFLIGFFCGLQFIRTVFLRNVDICRQTVYLYTRLINAYSSTWNALAEHALAKDTRLSRTN